MAAPWSSFAAPRPMRQDVWPLRPTISRRASRWSSPWRWTANRRARSGEMGCGEEGCEDVQLSPDGQFAVWAARKQLWIAPVSGATPAHQLTDLPGSSNSPRWSPDGHHIAFVSDRGDHSFIAIYDFGHDSARYLAPSVDRDGSPRWSPDGKQVAFLRAPGTKLKAALIPDVPVPWSIWVADAATGAGHQVWQSGDKLEDSFPYLTRRRFLSVSVQRPPRVRLRAGWLEPPLLHRNQRRTADAPHARQF